MPCKYMTTLPPVPNADAIGGYIRLERVKPEEDGREANSFRTFRVTIENPVGGTYAYRVKTRALAEEFIARVQAVKLVVLICNA